MTPLIIGVHKSEALIQRVSTRRVGLYESLLKRPIDTLLAASLLVVAAPILAITAVVVYVTMGSPVILRQERLGKHGKPFTVYKFRTMLPDRRMADTPFTGPDRRKVHKSPDDPRITPVGRWLRRTSIDELPQLFNVLSGDMSMVGPRPELPSIADGYEPWQHLRHTVKPGITGLWQIAVRDSGELMHERTEFDLGYIDQISVTTDMKILALTVPSVLGRSLRTRQ